MIRGLATVGVGGESRVPPRYRICDPGHTLLRHGRAFVPAIQEHGMCRKVPCSWVAGTLSLSSGRTSRGPGGPAMTIVFITPRLRVPYFSQQG